MTDKAEKPKRSNQEWLELLGRKPSDPARDVAVEELYQVLYAKAYFICTNQYHLAMSEASMLAADVAADQICKVLEGRGLENFRGESHFLTYITSHLCYLVGSQCHYEFSALNGLAPSTRNVVARRLCC